MIVTYATAQTIAATAAAIAASVAVYNGVKYLDYTVNNESLKKEDNTFPEDPNDLFPAIFAISSKTGTI